MRGAGSGALPKAPGGNHGQGSVGGTVCPAGDPLCPRAHPVWHPVQLQHGRPHGLPQPRVDAARVRCRTEGVPPTGTFPHASFHHPVHSGDGLRKANWATSNIGAPLQQAVRGFLAVWLLQAPGPCEPEHWQQGFLAEKQNCVLPSREGGQAILGRGISGE